VSESPDGLSIVAVNSAGTGTLRVFATAREKSAPARLGANNAAIFRVSTSEILLGARNPAEIKVWNPGNCSRRSENAVKTQALKSFCPGRVSCFIDSLDCR
jgi:hypothetical protein